MQMSNRPKKICLISLNIIREMQIKTTMRFHIKKYSLQMNTPSWSEWSSSKSLQKINAVEIIEKRVHSYTVGRNVNWYSHYGEQCGNCLKN